MKYLYIEYNNFRNYISFKEMYDDKKHAISKCNKECQKYHKIQSYYKIKQGYFPNSAVEIDNVVYVTSIGDFYFLVVYI